MEDLILKIIDIEDRAQEVIRDAREADMELGNRLETETKKLEKDIVSRMEKKKVEVKRVEDEDADKKIKSINAGIEEQIKSLNEKFGENKDRWVDAIVGNIIGR